MAELRVWLVSFHEIGIEEFVAVAYSEDEALSFVKNKFLEHTYIKDREGDWMVHLLCSAEDGQAAEVT